MLGNSRGSKLFWGKLSITFKVSCTICGIIGSIERLAQGYNQSCKLSLFESLMHIVKSVIGLDPKIVRTYSKPSNVD